MSSRLDTLPPETLFNILSYAEPTCDPTLISYPLCTMAATNKYLNAVVEEYARSLLKQHTNTTGRKASTNTWRRKWLAQTCQYCKKNTKRKATLYPALTCCRQCDWENFPKMTMTGAINVCTLSKLDLFTPNALHSDLPRLAIGPYAAHGNHAVMILEADVFARRDHIYQLLGSKSQDPAYMRKRLKAHERLVIHLGLHFHILECEWKPLSSPPSEHFSNSPKTKENRKRHVEYALETEWAAMGLDKPALESAI